MERKRNALTSIRVGCKYKIEVSFRVQHEIVSGLCFVNSVYKGPIKVTTDKVRKKKKKQRRE
jgi:hypothetical protein